MQSASEASVPSLDLESIRDVLEQAPVEVAVLYGSHARGEATDRSDVDVAVGFDEDLSALDRTHARLDLMDRLEVALDVEPVDVVPLAAIPDTLLYEVWEDGILVAGSVEDLEAYGRPDPPEDTYEERMARFDEILSELERVV